MAGADVDGVDVEEESDDVLAVEPAESVELVAVDDALEPDRLDEPERLSVL